MENFKKLFLSTLCLSVMACGSSGSGDPVEQTNNTSLPDNENTNGVYKSDYCVSDEVVEEKDDVYVVFDAFVLAPDKPSAVENASTLEELADALLYSNLLISISSSDFAMAFGPIFAKGLCDAELTDNGQCDLTIPGGVGQGIKAVGGIEGDILTFDVFTKSDTSAEFDFKASTSSTTLFPYWEGSYRIYAKPDSKASDVSLISWRRDATTEYYSETSENGDFTNITEQSDCSGTFSRQKTSLKTGSVTTTDGSWQINGTSTTGEVTQCIDNKCNRFVW